MPVVHPILSRACGWSGGRLRAAGCALAQHRGLGLRRCTLGLAVNEQVWRLPILPDHEEELKSSFADCSSTGGFGVNGRGVWSPTASWEEGYWPARLPLNVSPLLSARSGSLWRCLDGRGVSQKVCPRSQEDQVGPSRHCGTRHVEQGTLGLCWGAFAWPWRWCFPLSRSRWAHRRLAHPLGPWAGNPLCAGAR